MCVFVCVCVYVCVRARTKIEVGLCIYRIYIYILTYKALKTFPVLMQLSELLAVTNEDVINQPK